MRPSFSPPSLAVEGVNGAKNNTDESRMAYIDSELAKRRAAEAHTLSHTTTSSSTAHPSSPVAAQTKKETEVQRQPASLGKLQEIDLGAEARDKNVAQTERARRLLDGEVIEDEPPQKPAKVRLGPDGKPWRSRKKRRGSDDIKRDRLVEDILRENRRKISNFHLRCSESHRMLTLSAVEIYDELPPEPTTINDDQAADDRIAEAFRREFMDAVSQRQRKKAAPVAPPARGPGGKKVEEELKGPKLGGSRSARAAHMEALRKQQQGGGKK